MFDFKKINILFITIVSVFILCSCKNEFKNDNYVAYFGGEIVNPNNRFVIFCKDNDVIDTIKLDNNNRFFIKFDSLAPGMYNFKNEPEYQYVYFDKNDSIMVRTNSRDFDESLVFCGRGYEKNNFLMELFLRNEKDKNNMFEVYNYDIPNFSKYIDNYYLKSKEIYNKKKSVENWNDNFDLFAKAAIDFNYFSKKELYPVIQKIRTGNDITDELPKDFYNYRKDIDYNKVELSGYSPYITYLSQMLNNVGMINYHNHYSDVDLALKTNINKIKIADTLIKNEKVKNTILNNIAFTYLLEDQNIVNNKFFLNTYHKFSTDKSKKNEIIKIGNAIQLLKVGNPLPEVTLLDLEGNKVSSNTLANKNTIFFFWTKNASSHFVSSHKKALAFKEKYPNYNFVAINLNNNQEDWKKTLSHYNLKGIAEYRCADFQDLKNKWAINKIYRTIILDSNGKIKNAFTNIFDSQFESKLK